MTAHNQPHKYRCETCKHNKTNEHSEEVIPGFVGKGSRYVDLHIIWCEVPNQYDEHWVEAFPYDERGCASHSSAIKVEQRIADVIKELEAKRIDAQKNRNWERDRGYEIAIAEITGALLRGDELK